LSISQKALGTLLEDGNVKPKHVGAIVHNKLNFLHLLVFHARIKEMQVQEAKSPVKISPGSVARRDLIPALKG
jgi:hypothetical protein